MSKLEHEEWQRITEQLPIPDELWVGVFGEVAAKTRKSWGVWAATYASLCSWAGRSIEFKYVTSLMYGMGYVLCLAPTGKGKEEIASIARALSAYHKLSSGPVVKDSPQSGEGLRPLLAKDPASVLSPSHHVLMLCREWSRMIQIGKVEHSTLFPTLNELFHRDGPWSLPRSERGDNVGVAAKEVLDPELSIIATTTLSEARSKITDTMVNGGFLNRYLILPGPTDRFKYWPDPDDPRLYPNPARTCVDVVARIADLSKRKWGEGEVLHRGDFLSPEAKVILEPWGSLTFEGEAEYAPNAAKLARLHFYSYHIALISAYFRGAERVEAQDAALAHAVCTASEKFVNLVWGDTMIDVPVSISFYGEVEEKILEAMERWAAKNLPWNCTRDTIRNDLYRFFKGKLSYKLIDTTLQNLKTARKIIEHPENVGRFALAGTAVTPVDGLTRAALAHDKLHKKGQFADAGPEEAGNDN